jgi:DNA (cytosine-5)-methyltransferase 1
MSPAYLTADDVRQRLRDACHVAGGQKAFAEPHSIPTTSIWDTLHKPGRQPSRAVLAALGLRRVERLYAPEEWWRPEHLYSGETDMITTEYARMASGLILPRAAAEKQGQRGRTPKAVDSFAGAGGFSLGLVQAGYHVVAAAEYDCYAAITYADNLARYGEFTFHFVTPDDEQRRTETLTRIYKQAGLTTDGNGKVRPVAGLMKVSVPTAGSGWISHQPRSTPGVRHLFVGDVRKLTSERILKTLGMKPGDLDLVAGGPPCQGYSKAGRQDITDPRNNLVYEYARFICELSPKAFVMEEVSEVATMYDPDGVSVLDKFTKIVNEGGFPGYDAFKRVAHGAPNWAGDLKGMPKEKRQKLRRAAPEKAPRKPKSSPAPKSRVPATAPVQMDMFA